jgi:sn-glycerol 3-phosphate transport system ATP-binding protein
LALGQPGALAGSDVMLGIRPEHLQPDADGLPMTVDLVEPLGSETVIHGRLPGGEVLTARLPIPAGSIGATLPLSLPAGRLHLFAADGRRLGAA